MDDQNQNKMFMQTQGKKLPRSRHGSIAPTSRKSPLMILSPSM